MFGKRLRFLTMVGAAAAIPYAWFNENLAGTLQSGWESVSDRASRLTSSARSWSSSGWPVSIGTGATGMPYTDPGGESVSTFHPLAEVLSFQVTPRWITDRWPRVSTVRAERDLVGLRVPLVTGTGFDDFAGSLTYYFDAGQRLRRITLHGQTGDDRQLVGMAVQQFGMHPEPNLAAGVYLLRWNAEPMNVLRVSHAPVVEASQPFSKLVVELEINDVGGGYGLSPEGAELLAPDEHVRQWNTL